MASVLAARPERPVIIAAGSFDAQGPNDARVLGVRDLIRTPTTLTELAKVVARCVR